MKNYFLILLALVFLASCKPKNSDTNNTVEPIKTSEVSEHQQATSPKKQAAVVNDVNIVQLFLNDVKTIQTSKENQPIEAFKKSASAIADQSMPLTKENVSTFLDKGQNFEHCVVICGNHTIVKISDFNLSQMSGSWGAKMPMGEGFIKKGTLNYKKDYLNNIIGRPDAQERIAYFFN